MEWARWLWETSPDGGVAGPTELVGRALLVASLALVPLLVFLPRRVQHRRFWCPVRRRDVEVEFEEAGLPGFRQAVAVKSCSAFDPPTAVRCRRRCLDGNPAAWEAASPVSNSG